MSDPIYFAHDELVLEVPDNELELVKTKLPELMQSVAKLSVPLLTEVGMGEQLGGGALDPSKIYLQTLNI